MQQLQFIPEHQPQHVRLTNKLHKLWPFNTYPPGTMPQSQRIRFWNIYFRWEKKYGHS